MPNFQYHVVKTDKDEFEIIAANEMEVERDGWVTRGDPAFLRR